jgi:ABC-type enterochelin transport system substrate-binding protein
MLVGRQGNQLLKRDKNPHKLVLMGIVLSLLISSCGENRFTQCEQIFRIARGVKENSKNVSYTNKEQLTVMKSWLEVASMLNQAADQIEALDINDSELIGYQNQLVTVYRIYSQATYDAVQARENKNIEALKAARIDAETAGEMQQGLIKEINAYCLNK